MSSESTKIDLGTHALRVHTSGTGAHTLVFLHGFLDGPAVWDGVVTRLADVGRLVTVQQRGHGDSSAPDGRIGVDDLAGDVVRVLDALGIARAVLVGHALGGIVALRTALDAPARVAGLALISTVAELDERAVAQWRHVVRGGEVNKLQGLARSIYGPTSRREADGDGGALTEIARALQELGAAPLTPRLAEIRCPTLIIAGERDAATAAAGRGLAAHVPDATLELVAQQGDAPHTTAPDVVAAALRALVARLPDA